MAPHSIHVAVLDTDVPCPAVYAKRGLYSSQFRKLLESAAGRLNNKNILQNGPLSVHITAFDAVGGTLPPLECLRTTPYTPTEPQRPAPFSPIDAILLTGSAASAYDTDPWIKTLATYIQTVYTNYPLIKLFGSCFGHQLLAQTLLSAPAGPSTFHVEPSSAFELGIQPITLTKSFMDHFPVLDSERFRIQLIHGDVVVPTPSAIATQSVTLPSPWMNMGSSDACDIQGLYCPGRVLSFQGHFEFDVVSNRDLCYSFGKRLQWGDERVAEYVKEIERGIGEGSEDYDEARVAAEVVMLFFAGEDGERVSVQGEALKVSQGLGVGVPVNGMLTPPL